METQNENREQTMNEEFKKIVAESIRRNGGKNSISSIKSDLADAGFRGLGSNYDLECELEQQGFRLVRTHKAGDVRRNVIRTEAVA
jgi:hypothetical protein